MSNNISKKTFRKIFDLDKKLKPVLRKVICFRVDTPIDHIYVDLSEDCICIFSYTDFKNTAFEKCLLKNRFVYEDDGFSSYNLYFALEFKESVHSLFELIASDEIDQTYLAFQIFQNIKKYSKKKLKLSPNAPQVGALQTLKTMKEKEFYKVLAEKGFVLTNGDKLKESYHEIFENKEKKRVLSVAINEHEDFDTFNIKIIDDAHKSVGSFPNKLHYPCFRITQRNELDMLFFLLCD